MKRIFVLCLTFSALLVSCNKEDINNTADNVGISKVTYFPTITVVGESIIAVPNGTPFTEPGVSAVAGTASVPVTTSGSVNTSQDGVYTLVYTAVNTDGFSATATRTVAVYTTNDEAAAHDLSGSYLRAATGVLSYWTKLAPGVYVVANPGGAASGAALTVVAFNSTGYNIHVPPQRSSDGNTSSTSGETYTPGPPAKYSWVFNNPGYGPATRTFVKQ